MNDKIAHILSGKKCPKCHGKIKRDVHVPPFGRGKNMMVWTCENENCDISKHWYHDNKVVKQR